LDGPDEQLDMAILHDLKARGATEFLALPISSPFGFGRYMVAFATDRAEGFTDKEAADLTILSRRLSVIADMNSQRLIAQNVLRAYLGPQTGPKVLAGKSGAAAARRFPRWYGPRICADSRSFQITCRAIASSRSSTRFSTCKPRPSPGAAAKF
jgi:hypothetical protein